jgi:transposase
VKLARVVTKRTANASLGCRCKGGDTMRGDDRQQGAMCSYLSPEQRVPQDHPLRAIRQTVDEVLQGLSGRFDRMYAETGRPSIAPEKLLRALLLQILYSVRSERMLMEQLNYNLLFRWFVGLNMDEAVWVPTVFSKNRDRLLEGEVAQAFFVAVLRQIRQRGWVSDEHFSVDGTLLEAWASQKSFQKKDGSGGAAGAGDDPGNPTIDFHGEKRSNQTHQSRTDPEALLAKKGKGKEAKLCYAGHVLIENRHGFVVNTVLTQAYGRAEPDAALWMAEQIPGTRRVSLGADKGYDQADVVQELRGMKVTPHVAQKERSAVDGRTTRQVGYPISQRVRKRAEAVFGWMKTIGLLRKLRHRGLERVGWMFTFTAAAYNLVRARNLSALPAPG